MTNRDRILELIRTRPGLTDRQIRERTGIEPHQQVNQMCRMLAAEGLVERVAGRNGRIVKSRLAVRHRDKLRLHTRCRP